MTPEQQKRVEEIRAKVVSTLSQGVVLRGYEADCALLVHIIDALTAENGALRKELLGTSLELLAAYEDADRREDGEK